MPATVNAGGEIYIATLRQSLGKRYSEHTIDGFTRQSRQFLAAAGVKDNYTRSDVLSYVDRLIAGGYRAQSIHTMLSGVRALFHALQLPWPLDRRDMHLGIPEGDKQQPTLTIPEVAQMIKATQGTRSLEEIVVALSTTYGLRSTEIVAVLGGGLDGKAVEVQTAKLGNRRVHGVPRVLADVLSFKPMNVNRAALHYVYIVLMGALERETQEHEGWHALRRSLVTELLGRGLPLYTVYRFIGWKVKDTAFTYYRPDPLQVDREIFGKHPYLGFWE